MCKAPISRSSPLATLPPHVIVGETSALADRRVVDLKGLAEHPMVLLDLPRSREYFFGLFHAQQLEPLVAARSGSPDVVRSLVANGVGYSLVNVRPRMSHSLDGKRVVSLRLAGGTSPCAWAWGGFLSPGRAAYWKPSCSDAGPTISDEHVLGMVRAFRTSCGVRRPSLPPTIRPRVCSGPAPGRRTRAVVGRCPCRPGSGPSTLPSISSCAAGWPRPARSRARQRSSMARSRSFARRCHAWLRISSGAMTLSTRPAPRRAG